MSRRLMELVSHESCQHIFGICDTFDVVEIVRLHSCPVIVISKDFLSHGMPIGVDSFRAFMDCFYDHVYFVSIHTSQKNHVVVSFVEHISIEEIFGSKSSQSLSVSVGCTCWILLCSKEEIDVMVPRFAIRFFFDCKTQCWLIFKVHFYHQYFVWVIYFVH